MHDASKVLLGALLSSGGRSTDHDGDPATFKAGRAVCQKSDGAISLAVADGFRFGVSLGKSLSNHKKTSVLRVGKGVPIELELKRALGTITISSYANLVSGTPDTIEVAGEVFTAQAGAATPGENTFQAATDNDTTAASLAAQIAAHATAGPLVLCVVVDNVITVYAKEAGTGGNALTLAYTDNDTNVGAAVSGAGTLAGGLDTVAGIDYVTIGAKVYFNDTTGKGDIAAFSTISDAIYVAGAKTGIDADGNELPAGVVDMPGGL